MQTQTTTTTAVALYARVSTDDQAERGTIQDQRDFLRRYAELHKLTVTDLYEDDGISGAIPLEDRPDGRRLLSDAAAGRFGRVIVYRLDRLGRSLKALIGAHDRLEAAGVTLTSGTEPFDTATPIGKLVFQLLGSIAEYERESIKERTANGRDRIARDSKYTGGVIPFGYDLDADRRLVPSARIMPQLAMTEAEAVRDLYQRIVAGSTLSAEARRLAALGVTSPRRYGTGKAAKKPAGKGTEQPAKEPALWNVAMLSKLVRNTIYKGTHTVKSRSGGLSRPVSAIVDAATWEAAQAALKRNRTLSTKNAMRRYLLRGLVRCGVCGYAYHGQVTTVGARAYTRYRCGAYQTALKDRRCHSKVVGVAEVEAFVWQGCREFILNPGAALTDAQTALRARMENTATHDDQRRRILDALAENEQEKDRIFALYKRGRMTDADADRELDETNRTGGALREELERLKAQERLALAAEEHLAGIAGMLTRLQANLPAIEATDDFASKREIVETLVREIIVETRQDGPRKTAAIRVRFLFDPAGAEELLTP